MITWQGLLEDSRRAVIAGSVDSLRRSVSTTYYAVFHALAASNADCLVGTRQTPLDEHAWLRAYRALDHRDARQFLKRDIQQFSPPVRRFIGIFEELQDARHMADYNPDSSRIVARSEATRWIDRAESAINEFNQVDPSERSAVAIQSLIKGRQA